MLLSLEEDKAHGRERPRKSAQAFDGDDSYEKLGLLFSLKTDVRVYLFQCTSRHIT